MTDDLRGDVRTRFDVAGSRTETNGSARRAASVEWVSKARIPTIFGEFVGQVFRDSAGTEHLALHVGDIGTDEPVLTRVHSECLTGDIIASLRCDCGNQLHDALERIAGVGRGVVVYLRGHEGRGIGIGHKIAAYGLQDEGSDTVDANIALGLPIDDRDYAVGAAIIEALGVSTIRLLTNNPEKISRLIEHGIDVGERLESVSSPNPENAAYLRTKKLRMGHLIGDIE
jgi:3,4-dihydroxy 2-butanone 4-phosphate synthase/GTP cyclohydrolase II